MLYTKQIQYKQHNIYVEMYVKVYRFKGLALEGQLSRTNLLSQYN